MSTEFVIIFETFFSTFDYSRSLKFNVSNWVARVKMYNKIHCNKQIYDAKIWKRTYERTFRNFRLEFQIDLSRFYKPKKKKKCRVDNATNAHTLLFVRNKHQFNIVSFTIFQYVSRFCETFSFPCIRSKHRLVECFYFGKNSSVSRSQIFDSCRANIFFSLSFFVFQNSPLIIPPGPFWRVVHFSWIFRGIFVARLRLVEKYYERQTWSAINVPTDLNEPVHIGHSARNFDAPWMTNSTSIAN